jgi:hypothetical protein
LAEDGPTRRSRVSRTLGIVGALARGGRPDDLARQGLRARATDMFTDAWEGVLDAVVRARLIERTVDRLLSEGTVDRVAAVIVESPATERMLARALESGKLEQAANRLMSEGAAERVVVAVVEHPASERMVVRALESARLEQALMRVVRSPAFERVVVAVAHNEAFDRLLDRALASERLDRVVAQIAESDEVRDALRDQSRGMVDEVTDEVRARTIAADELLERAARALVRRGPRPQ